MYLPSPSWTRAPPWEGSKRSYLTESCMCIILLSRCMYHRPSWIWYVILVRLGSKSDAWKRYMSLYDIFGRLKTVQIWWLGQFKSKPIGNGEIASDKAYHTHFEIQVSKTWRMKKSSGTYLTPRNWMNVVQARRLAGTFFDWTTIILEFFDWTTIISEILPLEIHRTLHHM